MNVTKEILYTHSKRSSRFRPGHWLLDSNNLSQLAELVASGDGWKIKLMPQAHSLLFKTLDEACDYVGRLTGKSVRKVTPRQLPRVYGDSEEL